MTTFIKEGLLFGMGNPLLDITASTDEGFLVKYGLKPNDAILAEEKHIPMYGEMIKNYDVEYTAGGAVQNTMRAVQWILGKPQTTIFMGCIGKDNYGKVLEDKATEAGVNVKYQYDDTKPTGTCSVVITKGGTNRSLCANLGAANCFTKAHLEKPEHLSLVHNAEFFYISGFFLTVSPESQMMVAKHAAEHNRIFTMNLSAPFICTFFKDHLINAMPYIDILFGNETEADTFAKELNFGVTCRKEIALKICALPKVNTKRSRIAIITQGKDPIIVAKDNAVTEYSVCQLDSNKVVDTNGAGDSFVGGFLSQLIQNKSLENCIQCGIYTATEVIQQSGCVFPNKSSFSTS